MASRQKVVSVDSEQGRLLEGEEGEELRDTKDASTSISSRRPRETSN